MIVCRVAPTFSWLRHYLSGAAYDYMYLLDLDEPTLGLSDTSASIASQRFVCSFTLDNSVLGLLDDDQQQAAARTRVEVSFGKAELDYHGSGHVVLASRSIHMPVSIDSRTTSTTTTKLATTTKSATESTIVMESMKRSNPLHIRATTVGPSTHSNVNTSLVRMDGDRRYSTATRRATTASLSSRKHTKNRSSSSTTTTTTTTTTKKKSNRRNRTQTMQSKRKDRPKLLQFFSSLLHLKFNHLNASRRH